MRLFKRLTLLSHRVNVLTRTLDPDHYQDAEELKRRLREMYPGYDSICMLDNLVYDGREILWNVRSEIHTDRQDPSLAGPSSASLAAITRVGRFISQTLAFACACSLEI